LGLGGNLTEAQIAKGGVLGLHYRKLVLGEVKDRAQALLAVHHFANSLVSDSVDVLANEDDGDRKATEYRVDQVGFCFGRPYVPTLELGLENEFIPFVPGHEIVYAVTSRLVCAH
jgi:hypothetical protein